jgi:hypothetical protein
MGSDGTMRPMGSAKAHGFLIAGLINDHLRDVFYPNDWDWTHGCPEGATSFCPTCCGPCAALAEYFNTPRGRSEADAYVLALGKAGMGYDWQLPNGKINWEVIEADMAKGWCPNHEEGKRR